MSKRTAIYEKSSTLNHTDIGAECSHVAFFRSTHTNFPVYVSLTECCRCRCKRTVIWDTQSFRSGILCTSACSPQLLCAQFQSRIVSLWFVSMSAALFWNKQHVQLSSLIIHLFL